MIIYFLIENVDVDHSPQCLRTHFNIIYKYIYIPLSLGLGPRSLDDVIKSKKCIKKTSKGKTHFRMQYFYFHFSQSDGGKTIRGKLTKKKKKKKKNHHKVYKCLAREDFGAVFLTATVLVLHVSDSH